MTEIRLGTSGWSYPQWRAGIYEGVPQRRWLTHYSSVLNAVEANITYRRDLSPKAAAAWVDETETGFRFAIKAHQRATHFHRLKTPADDVPRQVAQADLVRSKLGVVYFQLPHNFLRDDRLLEAYLGAWPERLPTVWEFLHPELARTRGARGSAPPPCRLGHQRRQEPDARADRHRTRCVCPAASRELQHRPAAPMGRSHPRHRRRSSMGLRPPRRRRSGVGATAAWTSARRPVGTAGFARSWGSPGPRGADRPPESHPHR